MQPNHGASMTSEARGVALLALAARCEGAAGADFLAWMGCGSVLPKFARRSTSRLLADLQAARNAECHCDDYVGFNCGIHSRRMEIEHALRIRAAALRARALAKETNP